MRQFIIYFSPTGGTKMVAQMVGDNLDGERTEIDLMPVNPDMSACRLSPHDIAIVAVPVFGGRVPQVAVERLRGLEGGGAKAILIAVYGNRAYEDALVELRDVMSEAGFLCIAGIGAVAEHSIARQYASGRPDDQDQEQLAGFALKIKECLLADEGAGILDVPGNTPYKEYKVLPMVPQVNSDCTGCGLCGRQCPVEAIPLKRPETTEEERCISCMHCVAVCPQKARRVNEKALEMVSAKLESLCADRKENELWLSV